MSRSPLMAESPFKPVRHARLDWLDGQARSTQFDDTYFSKDDGIGESEFVFLQGNNLAERFRGLPEHSHFVIGETGFGTGLNLLLAARLFLTLAPSSCRLHFVSVESYPLSREDLVRAHQAWDQLTMESRELLQHYPPASPGFHRRWLFHGRVALTLALGDATDMLSLAQFQADAWFLDGFAPARNDSMWNPALYQQLYRLSRPGATLATFTAAGHVRRGLTDAGFMIQRLPGYGRKRHMLSGQAGEEAGPATASNPLKITVVGAGLAGATCARALADRGHHVSVVDARGIAQGASGNLAGVVYTSASAHPTAQNRFYQASFLHALHWLDRYGFPDCRDHGVLGGVLQAPADQRHREKARQALAAELWDPATMTGDSESGTLTFPGGGCISPPAWCRHLLDHPHIRFTAARVTGVQVADGRPVVHLDGSEPQQPDHLVLANEASALELLGDTSVDLKRIRGQVTQVAATEESLQWLQAQCHRGYLSPAIRGEHCVGATFNLHHHDPAPREEDDQQNLAELAEHLPEHWRALGGDRIQMTDRRVGFRCQSPDFLPLAGQASGHANIWLSIAHGSRGITGTALAAEIIAAGICQEPCPVDSGILSALNPQRFALRQQRKARRRS